MRKAVQQVTLISARHLLFVFQQKLFVVLNNYLENCHPKLLPVISLKACTIFDNIHSHPCRQSSWTMSWQQSAQLHRRMKMLGSNWRGRTKSWRVSCKRWRELWSPNSKLQLLLWRPKLLLLKSNWNRKPGTGLPEGTAVHLLFQLMRQKVNKGIQDLCHQALSAIKAWWSLSLT